MRWNEGWRQAQWVDREEAQLKVRWARLTKTEAALTRRYGNSWPRSIVDAYRTRQEALIDKRERLERGREEPWFPQNAIHAIGELLGGPASERLLGDLFRALRHLHEHRERQRFGEPRLSTEQRRKLERIEKALRALLVEASDPKDTQRLIGGWAHGLLNGQSFAEIVKSCSALYHEVGTRLMDYRSPPSSRPKDEGIGRFYSDVVIALADAGIETKKSRTGKTARLVKLLLEMTDEQVPQDLFRALSVAIDEAGERIRMRAQRRSSVAKFFDESEEVR